MKGKSNFTAEEIKDICNLISEKLEADSEAQKIIRNKIRKIGFYASDFGLRGGYTVPDFLNAIGAKFQKPLKSWINRYKQLITNQIPEVHYNELYKWESIQHFQDNWSDNHDKSTILAYLKASFNKENNNLWSGSHFLPFTMLKVFAESYPEKTSDMFHVLFDEKKSLHERLEYFQKEAEEMITKLPKELKSHYQDERALMVYLTLRFPDKYYFYKNSMINNFCEITSFAPKPGRSKKFDYKVIDKYHEICDSIRLELEKQSDLISAHKSRLPDEIRFNDDNHILTQDFIYAVTTYLSDQLKHINLNGNSVFKISMGDFPEEEVTACVDLGIVLVHSGTKGKGRSSISQGEVFRLGIEEGDFFYLTKGSLPLLVGKFINESEKSTYKNYGNEGWLQRQFETIIKLEKPKRYTGTNKWWSPINNSTCIKIDSSEIPIANEELFKPYFNLSFIKDSENSNQALSINTMNSDLNQILYGPPGTGKTYHTVNRALSIIEGKPEEELKKENRPEIKRRFDDLVKSGRIVFTTFHQSMSYEDFIEGLKPLEPKTEGGNVIYKVENGLFKRIAVKADENFKLSIMKSEGKGKIPFETVFEELEARVEDAKLANQSLRLNLESSYFDIFDIVGHSIKMRTSTGTERNTMTKPTLERIYEAPENLDSIIKGGMRGYYRALVKWLEEVSPESVTEIKSPTLENYVIIIDEINRGNVSQIFGELITLIEKDKRYSMEEALQVTLPYSGARFSVPPNLYILGTMNTADRSVEALDVALRRRFTFEHMPPDYELADLNHPVGETGKTLADLLRVINDRIKFLKDEDHQIGHSYFLKKTTEEQLKETFAKNIIPLLKEYFYNDYSKIRLVLGNGFMQKVEMPKFPFKEHDQLDAEDSYILKRIDDSFDILEALKTTLAEH